MAPDDGYLAHVLRVHAADIVRFCSAFAPDDAARRHASLVLRGGGTVGVVVVRGTAPGVAHIELDHVTPRVRGSTPGEHRRRLGAGRGERTARAGALRGTGCASTPTATPAW